jgi:hypothetical protein
MKPCAQSRGYKARDMRRFSVITKGYEPKVFKFCYQRDVSSGAAMI